MGFVDTLKKIPVIGQAVSVGEAAVNIVSVAMKVLGGVVKTFDKFPLNLVCGLIVIILTVFREIIKVPFLGNFVVFVVYIVPFLVRLGLIYLRYGFLAANAAIVRAMDPEVPKEKLDAGEASQSKLGSAARKVLIWMQACHPDPRQWFLYANNHFDNTHKKRFGVACMKPCRPGYRPHAFGLLCQRADWRVPRYCPRAMVMRALEGLPVDGPQNFGRRGALEEYSQSCDAAGVPLTPHELEHGAEDPVMEMLARGVCQQADLVLEDPAQILPACRETYCRNGAREPFCSKLYDGDDPSVGGDLLNLLKILGIAMLTAATLQGARYVMYEAQMALVIEGQKRLFETAQLTLNAEL